MLPDAFRVTPTPTGADQLAVIGRQPTRPDVTCILVAADADRKGELLARWILRALQATQPVERLGLSDNTPDAIRAARAPRQPARDDDGLAAAAEARAQADWLVRRHATRASLCAMAPPPSASGAGRRRRLP